MNRKQFQELLAKSRPALESSPDKVGSASALRFVLTQTFSYSYAGPVSRLNQHLFAFPPAVHGDQKRVFHRLTASPAPEELRWNSDMFGNLSAEVFLPAVKSSVLFTIEAVVERSSKALQASWPAANAAAFALPTDLTAADAAITEAANAARNGRDDTLRTAERICEFVHRKIRYQKGLTSVRSSAAEVFALGAGVCQDHAHLMLAMCRAVGIPARYVQGHLLGEGSTHAWVEVFCERASKYGGPTAVPFDPCHGRVPDRSYITVAFGRDYSDVPPASGTYVGEASNRLVTRTLLGVALVP